VIQLTKVLLLGISAVNVIPVATPLVFPYWPVVKCSNKSLTCWFILMPPSLPLCSEYVLICQWSLVATCIVREKCLKRTVKHVKCCVFWDIPPCSSLKVNQRFGGTYHFHLQVRKISPARNQHESRFDIFLQNSGRLSRDYTALNPEDRTLLNHCCES
jgi:hypothetical protein